MHSIAVIGAGTMGNGIAHAAAVAGLTVTLGDTSDEILQRALHTVSANLQRGVDKWQMTPADKQAALDRIRTATELPEVAGAEIAIEAIVEDFEARRDLFRELDRMATATGNDRRGLVF